MKRVQKYLESFWKAQMICLTALLMPAMTFGDFQTGGLHVEQVSCKDNAYRIVLDAHFSTGSASTLLPTYLYLGDGDEIQVSSLEMETEHWNILPWMIRSVYRTTHAYPGAGTFTIGLEDNIFLQGLVNVSGSILTRLYMETIITIDPYLGCNDTPVRSGNPGMGLSTTDDFVYFPEFHDVQGDSVSISLVSPREDRNTPVRRYRVPGYFNADERKMVNRLSYDPGGNMFYWYGYRDPGWYLFSYRVKEWRKVDGKWYNISSAWHNHMLIVAENTGVLPTIEGPGDTVFVVGSPMAYNMQLKVPESDSLFSYVEGSILQIQNSGVEVRGLGHIGVNMSHDVSITCTPVLQTVRDMPYSVDLRVGRSVEEDEVDRWPRTYSAHIWIAESPSTPEPPDGLMGIITSEGRVQLRWQDRSREELGFIVERADTWQPQFKKIGVLPPNASGYTDANALHDMQYTYRVRAVGTTMSGYTKNLLVQTPVVTAMEGDVRREALRVFPTVFEDHIVVTGDFSSQYPVQLILRDVFGRVVSSATYHSGNFLRFYPSVPSGLYFLRIASNDLSKSWKLWKK